MKGSFSAVIAAAITIVCTSAGPVRADELETGFITPPASARPHIWWHWMNGNITKEGITADLEAMQRVGIGGAQIFNVGSGIPAGPVDFFSPEWRELMQYAAKEADRLGLTLSMHNCAGWSSSGGPWITPDNSMQQITVSETRIAGPAHFSSVLPQPPTKLDFYRDIEVLAFPTPDGEDVTMQSLSPNVTASESGFSGGLLFDGNLDTAVTLPNPEKDKTPFIQFEFAQPLTARSAMIRMKSSWGSRGMHGVIQASGDGQTFHDIQRFAFPNASISGTLSVSLGNHPAPARFYRVSFTKGGKDPRLVVSEISFSPCLRIDDVYAKSGMNGGRLGGTAPVGTSVAPGLAVKQKEIIPLTGNMKPDGQLEWDAPAGQWTVLRIGYTPTGNFNGPASKGGQGLECDKLNPKGLDAHWAGFVQKVMDDLGPLAGKGKTFNDLLIDSYERGGQNWTPEFRKEFLQRRGYDPLPWLITMTGRVVDNPETSERFLRDMRRTLSDLFAENYYGHFKELCNRNGLTASIEPYDGPFESLQCGGAADIPMGEFWVWWVAPSVKLASSAGHIYGKPVIGAESFTSEPKEDHGRWLNNPYSLKALGDLAFCRGVNRYILHCYAMQPWTDRQPGMTMGKWGSHFGRTTTWWEQSRAWMKYIARSQFMLRQGCFVADAAVLGGENSPMQLPAIDPASSEYQLTTLTGYDYDTINADVLLNQSTIQDGRLVLKSGMSYRVLALSLPDRTMTPPLLRKLRDFVAAGLTLVGPPPEKSPSLSGYPPCDEEIQSLTAELWGDCDGKTVTEHRLGKGRVFWGPTIEQTLAALNVKPDFEFAPDSFSKLDYIHRRTDGTDIYFVSNQHEQSDAADCIFRVSGKIPELWHPDTGRIEQAPVWREADGRITVPLKFDPAGSVFVVFRKPAGGRNHIVSASFSTPPVQTGLNKIVSARYESIDGKKGADVTDLLTSRIKDGLLKITVANKTLGGDSAPNQKKQLRVNYVLNGQPLEKTAPEWAQMEINLSAVTVSEQPSLELVSDAGGQVKLCASSPGHAELKFAFGKSVKMDVRDVPQPLELSGPWELNFPPNWGAPAHVSLPKLISWTQHADSGVKYFSGTAAYVKEVEIPAERFGSDRSLWLDLGQVKNIAEVSVNGQSLGILWKPPFSVNITAAAKPGKNRLEIKVTNLWPNRLIGDEQLPPDCEWTEDGAIKALPQWLLDGKPSPTGRLTFTTWHHWKKDDALLESGLLGPVVLRTATETAVQ